MGSRGGGEGGALHATSWQTLAGFRLVCVSSAYLWENDLVDDNAAAVHFKLGKLLNQPLGLIEAQELWYTDAHKGGERWIPELTPDLINNRLHAIGAPS